jgi:nicotinamidase-related amidase
VTKALLLVDMSNDFIQLDGSLNCGQSGLDIIPYCTELVTQFVREGHVVFDARDNHNSHDFEIASGLFPAHNLEGTLGQALIPELASVLGNYALQWEYIPKKNYNAGYQTRLFEIIAEQHVTELHVVGVCTDICVRYTLGGLYEFKTSTYPELKLFVHQRGVASFNLRGHEDSLAHFSTALGCTVIR